MEKPAILLGPESLSLNTLFVVGFLDDPIRIGVHWSNEALAQRIRNMPAEQKQIVVDAIINAVVDSLNRRIPRVITAKGPIC